MTRAYSPLLPTSGATPRQISTAVNSALSGKINSIGTVTLDANQATTTLTDLNIGLDSIVFLSPLSANAKTEGHPWISISTAGQATLNHANNAQTDRNYAYLIVG